MILTGRERTSKPRTNVLQEESNMPKVTADFSTVQSGFGVVPAGDYRTRIESVEYDATAKNPVHTFVHVIDDPENTEHNGQKLWDRIYMNKRDGTVNAISLGKLKQYAEAIIGSDYANGSELDTDDFKDGIVIASVEIEPWTNEEKGTSGESNKIKRVLAAGE